MSFRDRYYNRSHGRDFEETAGTTINYKQLVLESISSVLQNMTKGEMMFMNAVKALDMLLIPHHDDKYKDSVKGLAEKFSKDTGKLLRGKGMEHLLEREKGVYLKTLCWYAESKFRSLMELVGRSKLLPEKEVELLEEAEW